MATMLEMHGVSRLFRSMNDMIPGYVVDGIVMGDKVLREKTEAVDGFCRALVRAFRFIRENEREARKSLPYYTSVPEEVAMKSALREVSQDGREPLDLIRFQIGMFRRFGFLNADLDIESIVDYRFLPPPRPGWETERKNEIGFDAGEWLKLLSKG
ncbi:MAG: hypothetical protein SV775_15180 [Thermodesulfobacteriota bacterium]|nr:hypothetical protein [Thermodesulfobacteriota bacterium]